MSVSQIIYARQKLEDGVSLVHLNTLYAQGDAQAHMLRVEVLEGAANANLSGYIATGKFMRADQTTEDLVGVISGNIVTLQLDSACYDVPGGFSVFLRIEKGTEKRVIFWGCGSITRSDTGVSATGEDAGGESTGQLTALIAAAQQATADANAAAGKIDGMQVVANTLSAGSNATASLALVSGVYRLTLGIPRGKDGTSGSGGTGTAGEDGGYYTPSVSSSGVLTWTASKASMPAVASTNIKGPAGAQGPAGSDGKTPVKGTDYFTASDKAAIVSDVLAALPAWNGGSY